MDQAKDKYLCETYPKLFVERHLPMTETCMCWGFEHGDGWFHIVDSLCGAIQNHIDSGLENHERAVAYNKALADAKAGDYMAFDEYWKGVGEKVLADARAGVAGEEPRPVPDAPEQVVVKQVKEKYGTLRFYYEGGDDYVAGLVAMAEAMSGRTCEKCGAPGRNEPRRGRWWSTLCEKCKD